MADAGLAGPRLSFYPLPAERERLVAMAYPVGDERALLRAMIDGSVDASDDGDTVRFDYPAVVMVAVK
jgi:hypothetical protein